MRVTDQDTKAMRGDSTAEGMSDLRTQALCGDDKL
jgi:hypothetical protein